MLTSGTGYFLAFTAHSKSTIQIMIVLCVIGSGLYKSTSQTLVESLYGNNDPRRDGAFSMTYTFTNIGVLFGPFLCGLVANQWFATKQGGEILEYGYRTVFLITAIVIWAGALFFAIGQKFVLKDLHHADSAKKSLEEKKELASIPLTQPEKRRMCVILILAFFTIFFWIAYNQASMSIALYMQEFINGRVDTSVTGRIPHRIPDMRLSRIRLFTKLIVHQLSIDTDIDFRTCQWICIVNHFQVARPRVTPFLTSSIKPVKETFKHLISKGG